MNKKIFEMFGRSYQSAEDDWLDIFIQHQKGGGNWALVRSWIKFMSDYQTNEMAYNLGYRKADVDKWMKSDNVNRALTGLRKAKLEGLMTRNSVDKNDIRAILFHCLEIARDTEDVANMTKIAKQLSELEGLHVQKIEQTNVNPTRIIIEEDTE